MRPGRAGPKSSKRSVRRNVGDLGDTDASSFVSDEDDVAHGSASRSVTFQSPQANEATDYGLEFTTSRIQSQATPRRCSTLRKESSAQKRHQARQQEQSSEEEDDVENNSRHANRNQPQQSQQKRIQPSGKSQRDTAVAPVEKTKTRQRPRKQLNPIQREVRFQREVIKLAAQSKLLIPRLPFSRLIREILFDRSCEVTRMTETALEALQTSAEIYLTQRLQDAYLLTMHRGRVTLEVRDLILIKILCSRMEN